MTKWIIQNTTTMKVLKIKDIVRTISITHKFDKDKLIAINTSDVENGIMYDGTLTAIEDLKGQFKKTVQKGDILFSEIRPANRRFALVTKDDCTDYVVSTKLMVLRKYNNEVDLRYFYYCLTNQPFLDMLQRKAENRIGSFPQITFDLLSEYAFPVPSLSEQEKIANIIFSLDHKIALNKQINDNLEAMAKQLYDYWFVQFDFPNEEGKSYKSSGGAMVWNEKLKREIPQGWNAAKIVDVAQTYSGGTPTSTNKDYYDGGDIPWINSGELNYPIITSTSNYITEKGLNNSSAKLYPPYTVLVALYGATAGKVSLLSFEACSNQAVCGVIPNDNNMTIYTKYYLASLYEHFIALSSGSARDNISQDTIKNTVLPIPQQEIIKKYSDTVAPIINKIITNQQEIENLTKQRDELLPLLMNGQATVNYHLSDD